MDDARLREAKTNLDFAIENAKKAGSGMVLLSGELARDCQEAMLDLFNAWRESARWKMEAYDRGYQP